jgi:hypothetical protein
LLRPKPLLLQMRISPSAPLLLRHGLAHQPDIFQNALRPLMHYLALRRQADMPRGAVKQTLLMACSSRPMRLLTSALDTPITGGFGKAAVTHHLAKQLQIIQLRRFVHDSCPINQQ